MAVIFQLERPFFVTYSCGSNLNRCYSKVMAKSYDEARAAVVQTAGLNWAFMYGEEAFAGQAEKYGMTEVPLQAQEMLCNSSS